MRDGAPAGRVGEVAGERYSVAFDRDVEVEGGAVEEEVAEGAADEEEGNVLLASEAKEVVEQSARRGGELRV